MRIMLDTNVIISVLLFANSRMTNMMNYIFTTHRLVLSDYIMDELKYVATRKFPSKVEMIEKFLSSMDFEIASNRNGQNNLYIRDPKDYPILASAKTNDVDILITGDKDFLDIRIDSPEIITPSEFINKYIYNQN